jgi:hypothetical protein
MNYSYEIVGNHFVTEFQNFQNNKTKLNWSIKSLRKNFIENVEEDFDENNYIVSSSFYRTSFHRTKKWVLDNHPELLI